MDRRYVRIGRSPDGPPKLDNTERCINMATTYARMLSVLCIVWCSARLQLIGHILAAAQGTDILSPLRGRSALSDVVPLRGLGK